MTVLTDADLYAPLKTSLILTNGSGNPTFNRTTTATMFDNAGNLITVPSGGVRFAGARCVKNLIINSENLVSWFNDAMTPTAATDPDGGSSAFILTAGTSTSFIQGNSYVLIQNSYFSHRIIFKPGSGTWYRLRVSNGSGIERSVVWFNAQTGIIGVSEAAGSGWSFVSANISPHQVSGWYVLDFVSIVPASALSPRLRLDPVDANGSNQKTTIVGSSITLWHPQCEDSTGQSDQSPSEYVSTNVLSTPWHGAGVDGVKFFSTKKDGTTIPDADLLGGLINPTSRTNNLLWCRDLTNAAWVKNNITPTKNQTGIDAIENSCCLLPATATDATVLQTITAASTPACSSFYVKRSVGSGAISFTRDGGSSWTDITSLINSSTFTRVKIENTSVTNPQVGFKIATSGDAIIVDCGQNEAGTEVSMPILTTTASVSRNADVLTYQTSGNFSDTAGTILSTVMRENWANNNGSVVGSSTRGLYTSASNSGAQGLDGANTVNGPAGSIITQRKIGMKWSGSALKVFAGGNFGASGSYDGAFNLSSIAIMPGTNGYVRDVAIWQSSLSDADMLSAASFQTDASAAGVGTATITNNYINSVSVTASGVGGSAFANNYIHSVDASAFGVGLSAIANNYIHSVSASADGFGVLSAEAIRVRNILSSQKIEITYYQPTITISI